MVADIDFKTSDILDSDGAKWTRIEAGNKYVDVRKPCSIDELLAALKFLKSKLENK